mgnify:FL=1
MVKRAERTLHGEHVAYGLLVQLVLENRDKAFIQDIIDFYKQVNLPHQLAWLGMDKPTDDEIQQIADIAMTSPSALRFDRELNADIIVNAINDVEGFSQ